MESMNTGMEEGAGGESESASEEGS
jgi:hypothetical protein